MSSPTYITADTFTETMRGILRELDRLSRLAESPPVVRPGSRQVFNPSSMGATGDGVADDSTALQAAIDAAGAVAGIVVGNFGAVYRYTSQLTITSDGVTFLGLTLTDATATTAHGILVQANNITFDGCAITGPGINATNAAALTSTQVDTDALWASLIAVDPPSGYVANIVIRNCTLSGKTAAVSTVNVSSRVSIEHNDISDVLVGVWVTANTARYKDLADADYVRTELYVPRIVKIAWNNILLTNTTAPSNMGNRKGIDTIECDSAVIVGNTVRGGGLSIENFYGNYPIGGAAGERAQTPINGIVAFNTVDSYIGAHGMIYHNLIDAEQLPSGYSHASNSTSVMLEIRDRSIAAGNVLRNVQRGTVAANLNMGCTYGLSPRGGSILLVDNVLDWPTYNPAVGSGGYYGMLVYFEEDPNRLGSPTHERSLVLRGGIINGANVAVFCSHSGTQLAYDTLAIEDVTISNIYDRPLCLDHINHIVVRGNTLRDCITRTDLGAAQRACVLLAGTGVVDVTFRDNTLKNSAVVSSSGITPYVTASADANAPTGLIDIDGNSYRNFPDVALNRRFIFGNALTVAKVRAGASDYAQSGTTEHWGFVGTTAQLPAAAAIGQTAFDTTTGTRKTWNGAAWG